MGLVHTGPGTHLAWYTLGLVHTGPGTHRAWYTLGLVHTGPGTPNPIVVLEYRSDRPLVEAVHVIIPCSSYV